MDVENAGSVFHRLVSRSGMSLASCSDVELFLGMGHVTNTIVLLWLLFKVKEKNLHQVDL